MDELVAKFEKNAAEQIYVSLREYRGHQLIDVRTYYQTEEGEWRPTKKGVSISVDLFPELKQAIVNLEKRLRERELIEPALEGEE
ncbi:MAG: transcriptional coactivator p15 [Nitrospinota bacterium]|nr:MAG: transcriptional coactivator p15 [Nitrospinota bacterium]